MDRIQGSPKYQPVLNTAKSAPAATPTPSEKVPAEMPPEVFTLDSTSPDLFKSFGAAEGSIPLDFGFDKPTAEEIDASNTKPAYDPSRDGILYGEHDPARKQRLNLYAPGLSETNPIISIEARLPTQEDIARAHLESAHTLGNTYNVPVRAPKIRSPYLKQLGKNAANNLIKDPIKNAWEKKEFSLEAGRGLAIAGALAAGALYAPTDTKFSTRIAKKEFQGYDFSLKAGLKAGHGDLKARSVGLSARPAEQHGNTHQRYDLKYDMEDKRTSFSYSRTTDFGGEGYHKKLGHFEASLFHEEERDNTGFQLNYRINW